MIKLLGMDARPNRYMSFMFIVFIVISENGFQRDLIAIFDLRYIMCVP